MTKLEKVYIGVLQLESMLVYIQSCMVPKLSICIASTVGMNRLVRSWQWEEIHIVVVRYHLKYSPR